MQLDEAYTFLTDIRPCGPKRDAIRGATYDVLACTAVPNSNGNGQHVHSSHGHGNGADFNAFDGLPSDAFASLSEGDRFALQYRILKGLC
jgi:hypothetical protein